MRERFKSDADDTYEVKVRLPAALSEAERAACLAVIRQGEAVDPQSAQENLAVASVLAIARSGETIVGVGAIKRVRTGYATRIARRSADDFAPETPELGYVAVNSAHRRQGLSHRIVAELLASQPGPAFATTSSAAMKKTLGDAGFVQKGHEWEGNTGMLSLWLRI